jgi:hypothetical protein
MLKLRTDETSIPVNDLSLPARDRALALIAIAPFFGGVRWWTRNFNLRRADKRPDQPYLAWDCDLADVPPRCPAQRPIHKSWPR